MAQEYELLPANFSNWPIFRLAVNLFCLIATLSPKLSRNLLDNFGLFFVQRNFEENTWVDRQDGDKIPSSRFQPLVLLDAALPTTRPVRIVGSANHPEHCALMPTKLCANALPLWDPNHWCKDLARTDAAGPALHPHAAGGICRTAPSPIQLEWTRPTARSIQNPIS